MRAFDPSREILLNLYHELLVAYGPQRWWPADSPFEVAVGAVLTQNTNWKNVERALQRLREVDALSLDGILKLRTEELAGLLRPVGYYNVKAERLASLCRFLKALDGLDSLREMCLEEARKALLGVKGIGPETADDILLYALERPVFVIDTYTRRLLVRRGLAHGREGYEELRAGFERVLPADVEMFQQYHALIVEHAKQACRKRARCETCSLLACCARNLPD